MTNPAIGLSDDEAGARLRRVGLNELPRGEERTLFRTAVDVGREPMFQLLIAAGVIYLAIGELGDASMLLASAVITVGISVVQERRTEKVLETLRDLTSPRALVMRSGQRKRIAGRELVPGDIVILAEGDRVPADAVLLSASELQTDESLLTGESVPVRKQAQTGSAMPARPGGDDLPFIFSGTMVVRGHGIAEVTATGSGSEIGKIGKALGAIANEPTPLHRQTARVVRLFAALGLVLSAAVALIYALTRGGWLDGILAGITLAMSMLPEEIPLVLTIFMVMGAWRISQRRVLTRRSATIEALGAATVLCSDKTGTLTLNRMSVAALDVDGAVWRADQPTLPERFHPLIEFAILASDRDAFDPMDKAFHELGQRFLAGTEHLHRKWVLAHEYPLAPGMLAVSHAWKALDHEQYVVAAKGAPEAIADLCHLDPERLAAAIRSAERMAASGMRVRGVACASFEGPDWPSSQHDFAFQFIGLVGLADPLRPGVADAVRECREAGIKVAMITGDYPATARIIAERAGIDTAGGVMSGDELERASTPELTHRLAGVAVFARIMPEQKLRIVEAFKAQGQIVAMTGDGVNDAPSLKAAHIGIAMGGRGTDVAREAAAIVLLDDDFGSIVAAIRLGRRIYDNLRKAMSFITAIHVPIAGLALLPLAFGLPLVFMPVHIAFLELVIDPMCSIVFEAETEEPNVMRRKPRDPGEPLFTWPLIAWSIFQGLVVLGVTMALFVGALSHGLPEVEARALAFVTLVLASLVIILVNRSARPSLMAAVRRPNPALWIVAGAAVAVLGVAVYVPKVRELFRFGPLHLDDMAAAAISAIAVLLLFEAAKACFELLRTSRRGLGHFR
ncbi:MAG TPA: cation-translocating P-type ATPase [Stellaceae bacterium]